MIALPSPNDIDIYGQAVLKKSNVQVQQLLSSPYKSRVIFPINGELTGFIVCETSMKINFSLFVESMNILLGQIITNLESESDLLLRLEPPVLTDMKIAQEKYELKTNLMYELNTMAKSYDCQVFFYANKHKAKEV
jgi:hypothetical protein